MAPGADGSHAREGAREISRRKSGTTTRSWCDDGGRRGTDPDFHHREHGEHREHGNRNSSDLRSENPFISGLCALCVSVVKFFLAELVLATLVCSQAPSPALAASESAKRRPSVTSKWAQREADRALRAFSRRVPTPGTLLAKGYERFLAGDFRAAVAQYKGAIAPAACARLLRRCWRWPRGRQGGRRPTSNASRPTSCFAFPSRTPCSPTMASRPSKAPPLTGGDLGFEPAGLFRSTFFATVAIWPP